MNAPRPVTFRPVETPAGPGRANSIIDALIEQLPAPGSDWPAAKRAAWLHMMDTAFTLVYGGVVGSGMTKTAIATPRAKARTAKAPTRKRPAPPAAGAEISAQFYIDEQGYARREGGDRILPDDVSDVLFDRRGEFGDLGAIIWSDETRGIPRGMQIEVSAVGASRK